MNTKIDQSLINHVGMVLDASTSMRPLQNSVVQVADNQVASLAALSTEMDQETRATVYTFGYDIRCIFYDKDVLRLPTLQDKYTINGNTALIDATMKGIEDLEKTATLYGDHAFLYYVITDGEENASKKYGVRELKSKLGSLPENWTVAAFVPNARAEMVARQVGFFPGNIAVWDTTREGILKVGSQIKAANQQFMQDRALGIRGSKSIFKVNSHLNDITLLKPETPGTYEFLVVGPEAADMEIRDFVEKFSTRRRTYKKGCAFYQLTKSEEVQPSKQLAIVDTATQNVYIGDNARAFVGLPLNQYVQAVPENRADRMIFVQSMSVNRKLAPHTMVLVS